MKEDTKMNRLKSKLKIPIRESLVELQGGWCYYCGILLDELETELDHILPISKGGTNDILNLCASCFFCNRSKNDKTVEEWRSKFHDNGGSPHADEGIFFFEYFQNKNGRQLLPGRHGK